MQEWSLKTDIFNGEDSFSVLKEFSNKKFFIVSDPFLIDSPLFNEIVDTIKSNHNEVNIFSDVSPDPPLSDVAKGVKSIENVKADILLAIGGGSAIDLSKGIKATYEHMHPEFKFDKFIAIPTTSGTGSETTSFTVITDKSTNVKIPIADDRLVPDIAILNVDLVMTAPDSVIAYSGLDVLTHSLESIVAKNSTAFTEALAEKAAELIFSNLENSYKQKDKASRLKVHEASSLAGMAFNQSGLGISHAIAHQVGAEFHIPHGLANAMLLPYIVTFNATDDIARRKYAALSRKCFIAEQADSDSVAVEKLVSEIIRLAQTLNCKMTLEENGVTAAEAKAVADEVALNASKDATAVTNPIDTSLEQLKGIFLQLI